MDASLVKLRIATFIPDAWLQSARASDAQQIMFRGDDRKFTPHTVNTDHSRVAQEVIVDFRREVVKDHPETGTSMERVTASDGTTTVHTATASTDGIDCTNVRWEKEEVRFTTAASVSNPLDETAPAVDFAFEVSVRMDDTVMITGQHDGFPCFEIYKQVAFDAYETVYTYDYRETGASSQALSGPMERTVDRSV
jgi:hypothetical protein